MNFPEFMSAQTTTCPKCHRTRYGGSECSCTAPVRANAEIPSRTREFSESRNKDEIGGWSVPRHRRDGRFGSMNLGRE